MTTSYPTHIFPSNYSTSTPTPPNHTYILLNGFYTLCEVLYTS